MQKIFSGNNISFAAVQRADLSTQQLQNRRGLRASA